MNVTSLITVDYENIAIGNLVKTNPIQSQSKPIKPNSRKARMDVSLAITRNYNNEQRTMNNERLCKTNPNKPNFYQKSGKTCAFGANFYSIPHQPTFLFRLRPAEFNTFEGFQNPPYSQPGAQKQLISQEQTARQLLYQTLKPQRYQAGINTARC